MEEEEVYLFPLISSLVKLSSGQHSTIANYRRLLPVFYKLRQDMAYP